MKPLEELRKCLLKTLLCAAKTHGEQDDPDHEVGDLQNALSIVMRLLSRTQLDVVLTALENNQDGFADAWSILGRELGPDDVTAENALSTLFGAARDHGELSEPDHEVGDLQDALSSVLNVLDPDQLSEAIYLLKESQDGLEELWGEIDNGVSASSSSL